MLFLVQKIPTGGEDLLSETNIELKAAKSYGEKYDAACKMLFHNKVSQYVDVNRNKGKKEKRTLNKSKGFRRKTHSESLCF